MRILAAFAALAISTPAFADVPAPIYEGECPPGLDRTEHGCATRACASDSMCGDGASCREIRRCASPPGPGSHPRAGERWTGFCDASGRCADTSSICRTSRQCEPTERTAAWDSTRRAWTGQPYVAPSGGGCMAGGAANGGVLSFGWAILALLVARRR